MGRPRKYFTEKDRLAAIKLDKKKYREKPEKKLKIKKQRKKRLSSEHGKTVTKLSRNTYERKKYSIKENRDKRNENARIRRSKRTDEEKKKDSEKRSKKRKPTVAANTRKVFKILGGPKCSNKKCGFQFNDLVIDEKTTLFEIVHLKDTGYLDEKRFHDTRQEREYYALHPIEALENLAIQCSNCNQIHKKNLEKKRWDELENTLSQTKARKKRIESKKEVFKILGGPICVLCGFTDERALTKGHKIDRSNLPRTSDTYDVNHPKETIKIYQVECYNCNNIKYRKKRYNI